MSIQTLGSPASPQYRAFIAKTAAFMLQRYPLLSIPSFGFDNDSAGKSIFTKQIRRPPFHNVDGLDIVQIDIDLASTLKYQHPIDHNDHTRWLAHIALVFDAAYFDLDVFTTGLIGGDAGNRLQHLLQVLGM